MAQQAEAGAAPILVATVNSGSGLVTAVGAGTTNITYTVTRVATVLYHHSKH